MLIKLWFPVLLIFLFENDKKDNSGIYNIQYGNEGEICELTNSSFQTGEKLVYKIYYNWGFLWMPAGNATFTVKESDNQYILKAVGRTYKTYNWFYEVNDKFYSYVNKEDLLPTFAKRDIDEGGYKIYNEIKFNQIKGTASAYVKENDKTPRNITKSYDNCMLDLVSLVYKLRNIDMNTLKTESKVAFTMMLDDEIYDLNFECLGKVSKFSIGDLGSFKTIKISPNVIKGRVFDQNDRMILHISDDKVRIPLYIESPLAVGSVKVILQSYENLRYPLAKVSD
jgi:hypothetical protein